MKLILVVILILTLFTGCKAEQTFETISDEYATPVSSVQYELKLTLPEGTAEPVMESGSGGELFRCENFWVTTTILPGGDMERTLKTVTGFEKNAIGGIETVQGEFKRFSCAWSTPGEDKEQICRTVILDDGINHHIVTVCCDYDMAGLLTEDMQAVLDSATLACTD